MQGFSTLLSGVLMFALLMVPGYFMGKAKQIEQAALTSMTNILMYVAMPFLVLAKLVTTDLYAIAVTDILMAVLLPAVTVGIVILVASRCFRGQAEDRRYRASRFCASLANCGFLGIPLAAVLFPEQPEVTVFVSLYNVVNSFLVLTVGVYILSGDRRAIRFRQAVCSPIMASILLGVLFSLTGVVKYVPKIATYADTMAALTTPLSMLVIGVEMSGIRLSAFFKTRGLYPVALIKLVISPMIMVCILWGMKLCGVSVSVPLQTALFLSPAMSTAASAPAMTKKYGGDGEYAAILTLGTTVLCAATFPVLYLVASLLLGW